MNYSGLEKRQFFGYWRWVHKRVCPKCKRIVRILGGDTRQSPQMPPGAIICPKCNQGKVSLR